MVANSIFQQIALSVLEWIGLGFFFWRKTGEVYRAEHASDAGSSGAGTREALKSKVTWLCALFFFAYMGVEGMPTSCLQCCHDLNRC